MVEPPRPGRGPGACFRRPPRRRAPPGPSDRRRLLAMGGDPWAPFARTGSGGRLRLRDGGGLVGPVAVEVGLADVATRPRAWLARRSRDGARPVSRQDRARAPAQAGMRAAPARSRRARLTAGAKADQDASRLGPPDDQSGPGGRGSHSLARSRGRPPLLLRVLGPGPESARRRRPDAHPPLSRRPRSRGRSPPLDAPRARMADDRIWSTTRSRLSSPPARARPGARRVPAGVPDGGSGPSRPSERSISRSPSSGSACSRRDAPAARHALLVTLGRLAADGFATVERMPPLLYHGGSPRHLRTSTGPPMRNTPSGSGRMRTRRSPGRRGRGRLRTALTPPPARPPHRPGPAGRPGGEGGDLLPLALAALTAMAGVDCPSTVLPARRHLVHARPGARCHRRDGIAAATACRCSLRRSAGRTHLSDPSTLPAHPAFHGDRQPPGRPSLRRRQRMAVILLHRFARHFSARDRLARRAVRVFPLTVLARGSSGTLGSCPWRVLFIVPWPSRSTAARRRRSRCWRSSPRSPSSTWRRSPSFRWR